jgi:hypothetical protein
MAIVLTHHFRMMANAIEIFGLIVPSGYSVGRHTNAGCSKPSFLNLRKNSN